MPSRTDTAARLVLIEESLARIEEAGDQLRARFATFEESLARFELELASRVPIAEVRQAIEDVFATYGIVAQLKEVYENQRNQLTILIGLATQLIAESKEGDEEQRALLVQLREIGRKHVRGLSDLERAHDWHEQEAERRGAAEWQPGDAERRRVG